MTKGVYHADPGTQLTSSEYIIDGSHTLAQGSSFPGSPTEADLYYRTDLHEWYVYNGTAWAKLNNQTSPVTADGASLGSTALEWNNLYIGTGRTYYYSDQAESIRSDGGQLILTADDTDVLYVDSGGTTIYPQLSVLRTLEYGSVLFLYKKYTAANNEAPYMGFYHQITNGGADTRYAYIQAGSTGMTIASENGINMTITSNGGTITLTGAVVPDSASTRNLGSTTAEWNNFYLGTGRYYLYSDQGESIRSDGTDMIFGINSADELQLDPSALHPTTDLGLDLGTSTLKFDIAYLSQFRLIGNSTTDATAYGIVASMVAGASLVWGDVVYIATDGQVELADADATSTMPAMGIALGTYSVGNAANILVYGFVTETDWNWTTGNLLYVSTTTGDFTATAPSGNADVVQAVGLAVNADTILFNPSLTMVEVVA